MPRTGGLPAMERILTDHLLEEFLVRLDSPADLIRASAACKTFRRLATDPTFLRRYRSVHPPQLLGFLISGFNTRFVPPDAPHRDAPAALAFAAAADLTFDHLPDRGQAGWSYSDARDGRIIMSATDPEGGLVLPQLAVCDPLTQGYMLLPPIPDGLVASALVQIQKGNIESFDAFFDPSGGHEQEHFRVMCWTRSPTMGAIFIYSSVSGTWTDGASIAWDALGLGAQHPEQIEFRSYAYGCLYWKEPVNDKLIRLNISSMEFSVVNLPENPDVMVVEVGEGRIGMFSLVIDLENPQPLRFSIWQNESENANEHLEEETIPLPNDYDVYLLDSVGEGYIFLVGCHKDISGSGIDAFFSIDIKTRKVEKVCLTYCVPEHLIPYFGFPPSMSPRRI